MGCTQSHPAATVPPSSAIEEAPIITSASISSKRNSLVSATNHLVLSKFSAANFATLLDSNLPQLIVGRIAGMVSDLRTPYSSQLCAFYRFEVQVQSPGDHVWQQKYSEVKAADFYIVDPQSPKDKLYICGNEYVIELISNQIDSTSTEGFQDLENPVPGALRSAFQKAGISENSIVRVRETIYEINTQLAVFGVVELGHPMYGKNARRLVPATEQSITEEYRLTQNWTQDNLTQWRNLFSSGPSRLYLSDSSQAFQGIVIDLIPQKSPSLPHSDSSGSKNLPPPSPPAPDSARVSPPPPQSKSQNTRAPEFLPPKTNSPPSHQDKTNHPPPSASSTSLPSTSASASNVVLVQIPVGATPGTSVRVPGPDGNSMMINIPLHAVPGDVVEVIVPKQALGKEAFSR